MKIVDIVKKLLDSLKFSPLTFSLIKLKPKSFFDAISKNPDLLLNATPGSKDVLILLMEVDQTSFIKMAVELKTSEFGNIMHFMANENMINSAKDLIEKIQDLYDAKTVTKLMFLRNSISENSPIMLMISKMSMRDEKLYNEEKAIINSIWIKYVNDEVFEEVERHNKFSMSKIDFDILSPNKQNQTILHLCIQSNMFELFKMICSSNHVDSAKVFDILDDSNTTPLKKITDEAFLKEVLSEHSEKKLCLETLKVVLWHICKNNFNQAFHCIKESMAQDDFLNIIMLNDDDGELVKITM